MSVEIPDEIRAEYRQMSTSELARRLSQASARIDGGAEYSDEELGQVQAGLGKRHNTHTPELARHNLFVNDLMEQQATTVVLEERKKEG